MDGGELEIGSSVSRIDALKNRKVETNPCRDDAATGPHVIRGRPNGFRQIFIYMIVASKKKAQIDLRLTRGERYFH